MSKNKVLYSGALTDDTVKVINQNLSDVSFCTTSLDVDSGTTGTTLANVVGMITDDLDAGTYHVYIHLDCLSTANSGLKAAFKFTGDNSASMLTSLSLVSRAFTATGVGVSRATTATDAASIQASTAAIINCVIEGQIVVAEGKNGQLQLQAAQNASHADNTTIYTSSFMKITKVV